MESTEKGPRSDDYQRVCSFSSTDCPEDLVERNAHEGKVRRILLKDDARAVVALSTPQ